DSWGQGIDKIQRWARTNQRRPPRFIDDFSQFTLVVYSNRIAPGERKRLLLQGERDVLMLARKQERITNRDCRQKLGLSKTQAQTALASLLAANYLSRQGRGRSTYYILNTDDPPIRNK
ncbi:MAG: hypothetical protein V3T17_18095, partial [Pseudomonadales bacterium]